MKCRNPAFIYFLVAGCLLLPGCAASKTRNAHLENCMVCEKTGYCFTPKELSSNLDWVQRAFHHQVHFASESYLVRVNEVHSTGGAKNEFELYSTIIKTIKGDSKPGQAYHFHRLSDDDEFDIQKVRSEIGGAEFFLFLTRWEHGKIVFDAQDPASWWRATGKEEQVLALHERVCSAIK